MRKLFKSAILLALAIMLSLSAVCQTLAFDGVDFLSVADSINFWVRMDGCNTTPNSTTSHNGNIVEADYAGGKDGSEVDLVTIGNGKHDWPSTALPDQISATDAIWEFFAKTL